MKKLFTLLALSLSVLGYAQTTYYTCATSGENTTNPDGVTGCVTSAAWNTAGNTLVVRAGTTLNTATPNSTFSGNIIVFGTVYLGAGGGTSTISAGSTFIVESGGSVTWTGSRSLVIATGGQLVVKSGGSVASASGGSTLTVDGLITGSGNVSADGGITGSGTINGSVAPFTTPIDLANTGITWDGTVWSPSAPNSLDDRAIFNGNYNEAVDAAFTAGSITINSGFSAQLNSNRTAVTDIVSNGTLVLVDNARVSATINLSGTGNVSVRRTFETTTTGWVRIGFPLLSGTCADLTATGFTLNRTASPANTIRSWDAASSQWVYATATTPLNDKAFLFFTGLNATPGRFITGTVAINQLNNANTSLSIAYHDPGVVSGFVDAATDGWNQLYNPFMDDLSSESITGAMTATNDFQSDGIAILNINGSYNYWNYNDPVLQDDEAEYVRPFQAFFVQTDENLTNSSFTMARNFASNGATVSNSSQTFKTQNTPDGLGISLTVFNANQSARTYIGQNDDATSKFDKKLDVNYYFPTTGGNVIFYSLNADGIAQRGNRVKTVNKTSIPVGFTFGTNGTQFTITADHLNLPKGVNVQLTDHHTGTKMLINKSNYTFTNSTSAPASHFSIQFIGNTRNFKSDLSYNGLTAYFANDIMNIELEDMLENATMFVYNVAGQVVYSNKFEYLYEEQINITGTGMFIIRIQGDNGEMFTTKVVKM